MTGQGSICSGNTIHCVLSLFKSCKYRFGFGGGFWYFLGVLLLLLLLLGYSNFILEDSCVENQSVSSCKKIVLDALFILKFSIFFI